MWSALAERVTGTVAVQCDKHVSGIGELVIINATIRQPRFRWLTLLLISTMIGCGKQVTYIPPLPAKVETHAIPNPDFISWSGYPVGTKLVRYKEISNTEGVVKVTTTLVLKDKTPTQVVVESQINVVRPDSSVENPPQEFVFPAEYQVPLEMKADSYDLPSPIARKTGEEKITLAGRQFDAEVFEWEGTLESGKVDLKLWRSRDFPGRQIRLLTDYRRDNDEQAKEEVVELVIPQSPSDGG